jgi:hypothetical protein
VSSINKVVIKTSEDEKEIGFYDLHNEYLIEIPLAVLLSSAVDLVIYAG